MRFRRGGGLYLSCGQCALGGGGLYLSCGQCALGGGGFIPELWAVCSGGGSLWGGGASDRRCGQCALGGGGGFSLGGAYLSRRAWPAGLRISRPCRCSQRRTPGSAP